ncbi:MAG: serine/threonine protein kinase, partial [Acidobacteria bacterium]|nr:serine/threonine protein kinase [Acidobacteriota bacterium]
MTPERWQQVDNLMQAALEQPAAARAAFLQQACAGDAELLREVESLLAFQSEDEFLEAPPAAVAAEMLEQGTAQLLLGRKLGRYELQRALGRGGMGAVYLALDTQLGRQVALKLLPRRFTSDAERVRRFRQEARAISALNHPNILTIHEIGEASLTDDG